MLSLGAGRRQNIHNMKKIYTGCLVKISSPDKVIYGDSMVANESFTKREIFGISATLEMEDDE